MINSHYRGVIFALVGFAFLCMGDAFLKKNAIQYDIVYVAFINNLFSILTLLILATFNGGYKNLIHTKSLKVQVFRGCISLLVYLTFIYAVSKMPIAQLYTIVFSQPFILSLLAFFLLKQKLGIHRITAICFGFVGVVVAFQPDLNAINTTAFIALLCAFLFACNNILVKFIDSNDHWMSYVFYVLLIQTPVLGGILFLSSDTNITLPEKTSLPWYLISGFAYTVGLALIPIALKLIDASIVGAAQYTGLIWGSLFGLLIFNEIPTITTLIGAVIIISSGLYLIYKEHKSKI